MAMDHFDPDLRALVRDVPVMLYLYRHEPDGRRHFPWMNDAVRDVLGVTPEQAVMDPSAAFERIHPDDAEATLASIERSFRSCAPWTHTFRVHHPDGSTHWVHGRAVPERQPGGRVEWRGALVRLPQKAIAADIDQARAATLQRVTDALRDVVMMTDADGRITFVNPSVRDVVDRIPAELFGQPLEILFAPEERASVRRALERDTRPDAETPLPTLRAATDGPDDAWLELNVEPLVVEGRRVGTVVGCRDATRRVEDARALRWEVQYRRALVEITNELLAARLDESFYQHVMERVVELVPDAQGGSLLVREEGVYRFKAAQRFDLEALRGLRLTPAELDRSYPPRVERIRVHDTDGRLPDEKLAVFAKAGNLERIHMTLSVPIVAGGEERGFLNLDNFESADAFSDEAVEVAEAVAAQVGVALQRLTLEAELRAERGRLEHLATHDALTDLPNRRLFEDRLEKALRRAERRSMRVAVVYVDMNGFKSVNDRYGHATGDAVLARLAARMAEVVRAEDTVARLGGDEFAVLLADVDDRVGAQRVTEALLDCFRRPVKVEGMAVSVGASLGSAVWPDDAASATELLSRADYAMYEAKAVGDG